MGLHGQMLAPPPPSLFDVRPPKSICLGLPVWDITLFEESKANSEEHTYQCAFKQTSFSLSNCFCVCFCGDGYATWRHNPHRELEDACGVIYFDPASIALSVNHSKHSSLKYYKENKKQIKAPRETKSNFSSGSWWLCSKLLTQILLVVTKYRVKGDKILCRHTRVCFPQPLRVCGQHCWLEDREEETLFWVATHVASTIYSSLLCLKSLLCLTYLKKIKPNLTSKCRQGSDVETQH